MADDHVGEQLDQLRVAQMEIVFQPLYRLTIGVVMIVLGSCLCAYGAIYSPNLSCNEMPDYDIGVGGLLIACGCSHLVGMCLSNGSKIRMQVHMVFDVCCIGVPLCVLFISVNVQYFSLTPVQRKECPQSLQDVTVAFLAFTYAFFLANCCCAPCIAATLRPGSGSSVGNEKSYVYREEEHEGPGIYIAGGRDHTAGTGYADDDRLLGS